MASDPIDYLRNFIPVDLAGNFAKGVEAGNLPRQTAQEDQYRQQQIATGQAKLDAFAQDQQRDADYRADLQKLTNAPSVPAANDIASFWAKYPDKHDDYAELFKGYTADRQNQNVQDMSAIYGLSSKNVPAAIDYLNDRRTSLQSAGVSTAETDQILDLLKDGSPEKVRAARTLMGIGIMSAKGKDDGKAILDQLDGKAKLSVAGDTIYHQDPDTGSVVIDYQPPKAPHYEKLDVYDDSGVKVGEKLVEAGGSGGPDTPGIGGAGTGPSRVSALGGNNPGGINDGDFAKGQPGYVGANGRFAQFKTLADGENAQKALLRSYIARGFDTPMKIARRWAPKGDGQNDPEIYAGGIARKLGIGVNDTLSPDDVDRFQHAQATQENAMYGHVAGTIGGSRELYETRPVSSANGVDQATVDFYGQKVAAGAPLPTLGSGKQASLWRQAILKRAADIQRGQGMTGGDSNLRAADAKTSTQALGKLQSLRTNIEAFEQTAHLNADRVLSLAPQGAGGSAPILNRWIQAGRQNVTGDPAVSRFNVAINGVANEYAKIMSGASGGAVTSDSARSEAMSILNNAMTVPQLQAAIGEMKRDMANRRVGLIQQEQRLRSNISGKGGSVSTSVAPPKLGTVQKGYRYKGGNPADPSSWIRVVR